MGYIKMTPGAYLVFAVLGFGLAINLKILKYQPCKGLLQKAYCYIQSFWFHDKNDNQLVRNEKFDYDEIIDVGDLKESPILKPPGRRDARNDVNCQIYGIENKRDRLIIAFQILENLTQHSSIDVFSASAELRHEFFEIHSHFYSEMCDVLGRWNKYKDTQEENQSGVFGLLYQQELEEAEKQMEKYVHFYLVVHREAAERIYSLGVDYTRVSTEPNNQKKYRDELAKIQDLVFSMKKALAEFYGVEITRDSLINKKAYIKPITYNMGLPETSKDADNKSGGDLDNRLRRSPFL